MSRYHKVLVICPGNVTTAGPEALHQLAANLIRLGQPAAMVYHPFSRQAETPEPYRKYQVPVQAFADEEGALIVFPEILPTRAMRVVRAEAAIWWMSVNNYTCLRYGNPLRDKFRYFKAWLKGRRPLLGIQSLTKLTHFAQSNYAGMFLSDHGIQSRPLSDPIPVYTTQAYLSCLPERIVSSQRSNVILYNPCKGAAITAALIKAFPQWQFKPLRGLDRQRLAEAFLTAKVYVDFGHHPGKDRLPREAALHGCCVITGLCGSAADPVDIPIRPRYKLNPKIDGFSAEFAAVVAGIFENFSQCAGDFDAYRAVIRLEPHRFEAQIVAAFGLA